MEAHRIRRYEQAAELLPPRLRRLALEIPDAQKARAEELRLRVGLPLTVRCSEGETAVASVGSEALVTAEDLERVIAGVTEFSRYASAEAMRQGYLTVRGGFRLGVCGTAVLRDGVVCGMKDFSGLALRIARERVGLSADVVPKLYDERGQLCGTLILSPPGGGKTTLLRDLIRCLSLGSAEHRALRVAVIDERSEIAMSYRGRAQTELGNHTDVLDGCPKALGIPMVLRAMAPQAIAVDELATAEDIAAVNLATNCGVAILATLHAASMRDLSAKPLWREVLASGVFSRAVVIGHDGERRTYSVEEIPCSVGSARV